MMLKLIHKHKPARLLLADAMHILRIRHPGTSWHTCDRWAVGALLQYHGIVLQDLGQILALLSGHLHLQASLVRCAENSIQES